MLVEAGDSLNPGIAIASTIFTEKLGLAQPSLTTQ